MTWTNRPGSSRREDGAKVGEFFLNGKPQWFAYPASWRPRCEFAALGPFDTRDEAKYAIDTWLGMEFEEQKWPA
jgi:hypothetical protein